MVHSDAFMLDDILPTPPLNFYCKLDVLFFSFFEMKCRPGPTGPIRATPVQPERYNKHTRYSYLFKKKYKNDNYIFHWKIESSSVSICITPRVACLWSTYNSIFFWFLKIFILFILCLSFLKQVYFIHCYFYYPEQWNIDFFSLAFSSNVRAAMYILNVYLCI